MNSNFSIDIKDIKVEEPVRQANRRTRSHIPFGCSIFIIFLLVLRLK